jgi:hypothetical protein
MEDNTMRGDAPQQAAMFSDISPEEHVPQEHPWRPIRVMGDEIESARHTWLAPRGVAEALPKPDKHVATHPAIPRSTCSGL